MSHPSPHPASSREKPFAPFVCFSIYAASLAFNRLYKQVLDRWGLTYPQYLVLVALREGDDRTVGELGELLFLESNTLTPLLKRMEAAGLVERRRDSADERVVRVQLSERGRTVADELTCVPGDMIAATGEDPEMLAHLPDLIASLDSLAAKLRHAAA
ncbi:MarR family transcriptional regulator [Novosphingobium nitrogenifigens DSM 19370]|uniref:MarR family transcriptional regulator n=1 Tax=Novosphingobium nitrogenifigens DSM 19370 TaxID=983920 RepID=F1ZDN2_9SPHN|nr:MarR family transcriptional regulator [Novosphingobium nitrogenifigens]EGD57384.1 MarR family transcriptional regulator [Novosphingobium nitrogenifigens DSM 19370]